MKRLFVFLPLAAVLLLAGCDTQTSNDEDNNDGIANNATLKIQNLTFTDLVDVSWDNVTFSSGGDPLKQGDSKTMTVPSGTAYIYFKGSSSPLFARTWDPVVVAKGEEKSFPLQDTTLVVDSENFIDVGQLKDLLNRLPKPSRPVLTAAAGAITVTWTAVSGAALYKVYCGTTITLPASPTMEVSGLTATITGLNAGQQYFVRIKAANTTGESLFSDPADTEVW